MFGNFKWILKIDPEYIVLRVGTNDLQICHQEITLNNSMDQEDMLWQVKTPQLNIKGTLMQIWKSPYMSMFI